MKNIIIFPLILLLVLYFIISFVVPNFKLMQDLRAEVSQKEQTLAKLKSDFEGVSESVREINRNEADNAFINRMVPSDHSEQRIINALSRIAANNSANLSTVGFFPERVTSRNQLVKKENTEIVVGESVVRGTYEQLQGFVRDLFAMERLYNFENVTMQVIETDRELLEEDNNGEQQLQLSTRFGFYHVPETNISTISPSALQNFSYDVIGQMRRDVNVVRPIEGQNQNRANPFLP